MLTKDRRFETKVKELYDNSLKITVKVKRNVNPAGNGRKFKGTPMQTEIADECQVLLEQEKVSESVSDFSLGIHETFVTATETKLSKQNQKIIETKILMTAQTNQGKLHILYVQNVSLQRPFGNSENYNSVLD